MISNKSLLIYGFGNPGRQDDGLGIMLAEELRAWSAENQFAFVHTDSNYQLNLEDAANIAGHDVVVFADASREDIPDFLMEPLKPSGKVEFSMHAVSPAFVIHLCGHVFNAHPQAYLLHIKGYEWEFMAAMTEKAKSNLGLAVEHLKKFISGNFVTFP
ncbi:MAG: hydrogenase maturation protease [Bacteroidales bacterium]|nr:hydrogenase maturation protease [Bacteroidales bacterium]